MDEEGRPLPSTSHQAATTATSAFPVKLEPSDEGDIAWVSAKWMIDVPYVPNT